MVDRPPQPADDDNAKAQEPRRLVPVVFLELPVFILFALYPGLFSLSQLAR